MNTPEKLITDEWIERTLEDIGNALPRNTNGSEAEQFSHRSDYRRLLRERILERLSEGAKS